MIRRVLQKTEKLWLLLPVMLVVDAFVLSPVCVSEDVFRNSLNMEFVRVPAGSFIMGSPPDEPHRSASEVQHDVKITRPFYIQTTEVTLRQWRELMGKPFFGRREGEKDTPVFRVSWHDCMDFIEKVNRLEEGAYRLPTEAEWEYACRSGTTTAYSWGDRIDCTKAMFQNSTRKWGKCLDYVNSRGLSHDCPAPVGSYDPNAWGIYDMHGNVWEWCSDWFGSYPTTSVVDPRGSDSGPGKVRRGGSWFGPGDSCRSANRAYGHPPTKYRTTGFRLVREVE